MCIEGSILQIIAVALSLRILKICSSIMNCFHLSDQEQLLSLEHSAEPLLPFFADTATALGIDCHLYSEDIDQGLIHEDIKKINFKNVTFLQGDVSHIEEIFPPSMLSSLPHPWIVVDDAHHNSINVLKYFNDFMQVGDYILAEDTDPRIPRRMGVHIMYSVEESPPGGPEKLNALKTFIKRHGQDYLVDSFLTDFYGHNCTMNWHGFLRKMV